MFVTRISSLGLHAGPEARFFSPDPAAEPWVRTTTKAQTRLKRPANVFTLGVKKRAFC